MKRWLRTVAILGVSTLAATNAHALGISVVGATSTGLSPTVLAPGDVLTLDFVLENATNEDVFGLEVVGTGYDSNRNGLGDDGLVLAGVQASSDVFADASVPGVGSIGGLPAALPPGEVVTAVGTEDVLGLRLFAGVATDAANGTGLQDLGVAGDLVANGDVHFRVQLLASLPTSGLPTVFNLDFGESAEFGSGAVGQGGSVLSFTNAGYVVTVVPEPGTALLLGLGLVGLASSRRR